MKSSHNCPACNQPLALVKECEYELYCANGRCKNIAAGNGVHFETLHEETKAYNELVKAVEAEIEGKPDCCD